MPKSFTTARRILRRRRIAGSEEPADVIAGLRDRMLEWLVETSDVIPPARDPRMDPELTEGLW
jgi:hypothetical protein